MKPSFDVLVAQCAFDVRKASILCCTSRIPSATGQERRKGAGAGKAQAQACQRSLHCMLK